MHILPTSNLYNGPTMEPVETSISPSLASRSSPSSSPVGGGCPLQQRSTYWCLTSWENMMKREEILQELTKMGSMVLSILGSAPHQCQDKPTLHRHWLLRMSKQIRKSQFPLRLKIECYIAPITPSGEDTLKTALAKYINYIKGKGGPLIETGVPLLQASKNKRTKNEEIMAMVLEGRRASEICFMYPQLYASIYKLMRWRPQRSFRTDLVYYYGPLDQERQLQLHVFYLQSESFTPVLTITLRWEDYLNSLMDMTTSPFVG